MGSRVTLLGLSTQHIRHERVLVLGKPTQLINSFPLGRLHTEAAAYRPTLVRVPCQLRHCLLPGQAYVQLPDQVCYTTFQSC